MKSSLLALLLSFAIIPLTGQPSDIWKLVGTHIADQPGLSGYFIIGSQGKIVVQQGAGMADRSRNIPFSEKTMYSIGSITKPFTATAILLLEEAGKLKTTDLISTYFAGVPADKQGITIHHLLTHSAGFPGAIGDDYEAITATEFQERAFRLPLHFTPGSSYMYSNVGYTLLGMIIEKVSGETYSAFLSKNIFIPAGMTTAGYTNANADYSLLAHGYHPDGKDWGTARDKAWHGDEPHWHLKANGGLLVTAMDMYHWYLALRESKILSPASLAKQLQPHVKEGDEDTYYGYGYVVSPDGEVVQHNGGNRIFKADFRWFPKADLFIFSATNDANVRLFRLNDEIIDIIHTGKLPVQVEWHAVPLEMFPSGKAQSTAHTFVQLLQNYSIAAADEFINQYCTTGFVDRNGRQKLLDVFNRLSSDLGSGSLQAVNTHDHTIQLVLPAAESPALLKISLVMMDDKVDKLSAEIEGR